MQGERLDPLPPPPEILDINRRAVHLTFKITKTITTRKKDGLWTLILR
jgi:hypothetical protein